MREELKKVVENAMTKYLDKMSFYFTRQRGETAPPTLENVIAEAIENAGYVKLGDKEADLLHELNFLPPAQNDYGRGYFDGLTRALDIVKGGAKC